MDTCTDPIKRDASESINWIELYPRLHALARNLVYKYRVSDWYGQEEDVAEDVTQETAKRLIERIQKASSGEAAPIDTPEQMMMTIAHHYIIDLVRREHRLVHLPDEEMTATLSRECNASTQMEEVAMKNIHDEWLFLQLAQQIAQLPCKQRRALLIDLAHRTCFDEQPTPLQRAFLAVGIDLQAYQQPLPHDRVERSRHSSLVSIAYRRISERYREQLLMSVA